MMRGVGLVSVALLLAGASARADVTDDCLAASAKAADLQAHGKLVEARASLLKCAADTCPAKISAVCTQRKDQVVASIPTIVFDVKDKDGNDVADVTVTIDGAASTQSIASAFSADPGSHTFGFRAPSKLPVDKAFVLHEGEHGRRETIVLHGPNDQTTPGTVETTSTGATSTSGSPVVGAEVDSSRGTGQRILGITLISVGIAGGIVAGIFGGLWIARHDTFDNDNCGQMSGGNCDGLRSDEGTFSTWGFVTGAVGGAAIIGGIIVFATAPKASSKSALRIVPSVGRGTVGCLLEGRF